MKEERINNTKVYADQLKERYVEPAARQHFSNRWTIRCFGGL